MDIDGSNTGCYRYMRDPYRRSRRNSGNPYLWSGINKAEQKERLKVKQELVETQALSF